MDNKDNVVDHVYLDSGGQVLASSFDIEKFHLDDLKFVINRINPLIENIRTYGLCCSTGPSGFNLLSVFWRIVQEGKRDRVLNHSFFFPKDTYYSLGANPFRFTQLIPYNQISRGNIESLNITLLDKPKINMISILEKSITKIVLQSYFLSLSVNIPICLGSRENGNIIQSILDIVPLPTRMISFTTFANRPDPIFKFILTTPENYSNFSDQKFIIINSTLNEQKEIFQNLKINSYYNLINNLVELYLIILEKHFDFFDLFDKEFNSLNYKEYDFNKTCLLILQIFSKINSSKTTYDKFVEESLRNLEQSIIETFPNKASQVLLTAYDRSGTNHLLELTKKTKLNNSDEFKNALISSLQKALDCGNFNDMKNIISYICQSNFLISDSNEFINRLIKLEKNIDDKTKITELLSLTVDCIDNLNTNTFENILLFFKSIDIDYLNSNQKKILQKFFDRFLQVREQIFADSKNNFIELIFNSNKYNLVVKEFIENKSINRLDKIQLLVNIIKDSRSHLDRDNLNNLLFTELRNIVGLLVFDRDVFESVNLLPINMRSDIVAGWIKHWRDYYSQSYEIQYLSLISSMMDENFKPDNISTILDELSEYAIMTFYNYIKRNEYDMTISKNVIQIISNMNEDNRKYIWNSKKFRKAMFEYIKFYWSNVKIKEEKSDLILKEFYEIIEKDIEELYKNIEKISQNQKLNPISTYASKTIIRLIQEVNEKLLINLKIQLSPQILELIEQSRIHKLQPRKIFAKWL